MGRRVKSAQQNTAAWKRAMQSGETKTRYSESINNVQENPMAKAAEPEARRRYAQNTQDAAADGGRMEKGLLGASFAGWKQNAAGVGASALSTGATKAESKVAAFHQRFQSAYQQASDDAAAVSKDDPLGKVRAAMNAMKVAAGKSPI